MAVGPVRLMGAYSWKVERRRLQGDNEFSRQGGWRVASGR